MCLCSRGRETEASHAGLAFVFGAATERNKENAIPSAGRSWAADDGQRAQKEWAADAFIRLSGSSRAVSEPNRDLHFNAKFMRIGQKSRLPQAHELTNVGKL